MTLHYLHQLPNESGAVAEVYIKKKNYSAPWTEAAWLKNALNHLLPVSAKACKKANRFVLT